MFLLNGNTAELTMDDMLLSDPISAMQYAQGTLSISEEAIAFQSSSKVGKRMVAFFEECYKIREEKYNEIEDNIDEVSDLIADKIKKEFAKIWLDELGLDIKRFVINTGSPSGNIAIDYSVQDIEGTITGNDVVSGTDKYTMFGFDRKSDKFIRRLKAMADNALSFDKIKGKLTNYKWPIILYFDIRTMFFADRYILKEKLGADVSTAKLTPRELTAIYLHEAGHAMIFIERIAYAYAINDFAKININGFLESDPDIYSIRSFLVEYLDVMVKKGLNNADTSDFEKKRLSLTKTLINKLVSFLDLLIAAKEGIEVKFTQGFEDEEVSKLSTDDVRSNANDSIFNYIIVLIQRILVAALMAMSMYIYVWVIPRAIINGTISNWSMYVFMFNLTSELVRDLNTENSVRSNYKLSDVKGTDHNVYNLERLADEHAVRHGFGGDLASGLHKITELYSFGNANKYVRESFLIRSLTKVIILMSKFHTRGCGTHSVYEHHDARIRRMCQSIVAVFKDPKISGEVRDAYITQMNQAMSTMEKFGKNFYDISFVQTLGKILISLITPSEWIRICTSGKLTQEYESQLNKLENLSSNLMYFNSAKLKSIASSMKK